MIIIVPLIFLPLMNDIFSDFTLLFYLFWSLLITSLKWMHTETIKNINATEIKKN